MSYFIKRVTFKLHDTYTNPNRSESLRHPCFHPETHPYMHTDVDKPPFEVSETGCVRQCEFAHCVLSQDGRWGEFEITIRITFVPDGLSLPKDIAKI